jgi:8-oxo-dGTP pyrophosphatase MutT (NUDIX family)
MSERRAVHNAAGQVVKAGCMVRGERGLWLFIRDPRQDYWGLAKGHVERGESPEAAAVREVREETGYEVRTARELPVLEYTNSETGEQIYTYHWLAEALRQVGPGTARHAWFTLDEALAVVFPNVALWLAALRQDGVIQ